jgi:hypothetical protein
MEVAFKKPDRRFNSKLPIERELPAAATNTKTDQLILAAHAQPIALVSSV